MRFPASLVLVLLPSLAAAQQPAEADIEAARVAFDAGVEALRNENYPAALAAFQESQRLHPVPLVVYNIAMCQRALFDYPASLDSFQKYLGSAGAEEPAERIEEARVQSAELEALVATVSVTVAEAGARVLVDGRDVGATPLSGPVRLGPGAHVIEIRKPGFEDARHTVALDAGQRVEMVLALGPAIGPVETAPPGPGTGMLPETPGIPVAPPAERVEEEESFFSGPWFWVILGTVLVGGGVTAGVLLWPEESPGLDWMVHGL